MHAPQAGRGMTLQALSHDDHDEHPPKRPQHLPLAIPPRTRTAASRRDPAGRRSPFAGCRRPGGMVQARR